MADDIEHPSSDIENEVRAAQAKRAKFKDGPPPTLDAANKDDRVSMSGVSFDTDFYGGGNKFEGYVSSLPINDDMKEEQEEITEYQAAQRRLNSYTAPKDLINETAAEGGEEVDPFEHTRSKNIAEREDEYHARRFRRQLSPGRVDAFSGQGENQESRSYAEVMKEAELDREEERVRAAIIRKKREEAAARGEFTIIEDGKRIKQIIREYLDTNSVEDWRFESLMKILFTTGLRLKKIDHELSQLGKLYVQQIDETNTDTSAEESVKKISDIKESIKFLCLARPIMKLVLEYNYVSDSISTNENVTSRPESSKQDKPLTQEQQQHFTKLTSKEKLIALVQRLGNDGHLDLTTAVIPRRYEKYLKLIRRDLQLSLNPLATSDERNWLLLISKCENLAEVDNLLKEMYSKTDLTPQCKYIRLCLASVQPLFETNQLPKKHHGEDWYRLHLYSFIFDKAFKSDTEFDIKRSECLSNVTKLFNDVPGQKLDFILRDVNDDNDFLSTEEKPSLKGVKGDLAKAKSLQKMMLREWRRRIGSDLLINEFEAITCQWEANKLTVFATRKITSDLTVTYRKGMFSMPKNVLHMSEFAKLLLAVLSLRRLVLKNYKKLNLISEAKQRDQVEMLRFDDDNDVILRSDSTADAELDDFVGLEDQMTMDIELEKELLNEIGKMKYESDVKSYVDWEEFIMEKAKRRRVSSASSSR